MKVEVIVLWAIIGVVIGLGVGYSFGAVNSFKLCADVGMRVLDINEINISVTEFGKQLILEGLEKGVIK